MRVVDVEIDLDFLKHWFVYTLDEIVDPKLQYLETIIIENKQILNSFFKTKPSDNDEVKRYKRLIQNIIEHKFEGYTNWYMLKSIINDLRDNEEQYKKEYESLKRTPLITKEQFVQLLEEKIKEQITVIYVDRLIDTLVEESKKLKDLNNVGSLTKKFNSIILSYMNSITNIITKYNSLDLNPENIEIMIKKIEEELKDLYNNSIHEIIPTGFETLDKQVYNGGFQKSRLYMIQGKTGFGKSVFLVNLTKNFLKQGKSVLFFTLENTLEETRNRLMSCISGVRLDEILFDEQKKKEQIVSLQEFFKKYRGYLHIEYLPTYVLTKEMVDVFVKIKTSQGFPHPDVIIIDYIDLMKYPQKTETERIRLGKLTQELKKLSQEQNCVVITPTQLNREQYKRKDVDLDTISESSMKSHFQDSILILQGDPKLIKENKVELQVRKNRHGKTHVKVLFDVDFDRMLFIDTGQFGYDLDNFESDEDGSEFWD